MSQVELVLVRHGVTAWNKDRRFQGHIDIPLDAEGERQARLAGRRLATDPGARLPIGAVYSSDLSRARQTAAPIAAALGLPVEPAPGLRERHYGAFEGRTGEELQREHADAFRRWREREPDFPLPGGGESLRAFYQRVESAMHALARRHPGQCVVAVTHGGVLDCAYRVATGMDLAAERHHDLFNASLNRIGWDGERFSLLSWADVAHLEHTEDDVEARAWR